MRFFLATGILRIETLESLFEMPPLLIGQTPPKGMRVGVMTTTGGGASTVVDRLGAVGLDVIAAPEAVHKRLSDFDLKIGRGPLIDLTMAGTREGVYGAALEALLKSDACDAVVCVVGSSAQFHPELAVAPIVEVARKASKPVAAFMVPQADSSLRLLADAGIAAFRTPEACADSMRAFFAWREPTAQTSKMAIDENSTTPDQLTTLNEAQSLELFAGLGIPVVKHAVVGDSGLLEGLSFPVVIKALSADLPHKTEAGAVKLNIQNAEELIRAIRDIKSAVAAIKPDLKLDTFLAEEMARGVGEALIGFRVDPQVGPVVVLAPGGILAEVYGDSAIRMAPIDTATAKRYDC